MTNKEAINILSSLPLQAPSDSELVDIQTAVRMAVKTLVAIADITTDERPIRCKDCKYQVREWRNDGRMKEGGYWVNGCKHFGEIMGYWGWGGNDNEFCSDAEQRGGENIDK